MPPGEQKCYCVIYVRFLEMTKLSLSLTVSHPVASGLFSNNTNHQCTKVEVTKEERKSKLR